MMRCLDLDRLVCSVANYIVEIWRWTLKKIVWSSEKGGKEWSINKTNRLIMDKVEIIMIIDDLDANLIT